MFLVQEVKENLSHVTQMPNNNLARFSIQNQICALIKKKKTKIISYYSALQVQGGAVAYHGAEYRIRQNSPPHCMTTPDTVML